MDEVSIVASEAEEFLNFCGVFRYWPVCDAFKFLGVHLYFAVANDDAKIVNFFLFEITFLRFEIEVVLF